ncbi:hypothetical protein M426DRAFT_7966 [Hypoxylon sp. CI-4A]|nr:hypothetical protein M426DRAFT_7966 [Hypoxylon sp. CI-4A]
MSSGKPWSQEEKTSFLVQVMDQLTKGGASIPFAQVNLPGRTTKSMTHLVSKLRAEVRASMEGNGNGDKLPVTPAATPKKANGKKKADGPKATTAPRRGTRARVQKRTYQEFASDDDDYEELSSKKSRISSSEDEKPKITDSGEDSDKTAVNPPSKASRSRAKGAMNDASEIEVKVEPQPEVADNKENEEGEA